MIFNLFESHFTLICNIPLIIKQFLDLLLLPTLNIIKRFLNLNYDPLLHILGIILVSISILKDLEISFKQISKKASWYKFLFLQVEPTLQVLEIKGLLFLELNG